jgi:hypothetical protein
MYGRFGSDLAPLLPSVPSGHLFSLNLNIIIQTRVLAVRHSDMTGSVGHTAADHIAGAKDLASCLSVAQLLVEGGSLLEADIAVLVVIGASD